MMTARRLLFAGFVGLTLGGCATTPVPTASAPLVPQVRVLNATFLQNKDGTGQVIVKRDSGLSAAACNTRIFANGTPVAEIAPGEKVVFYLPEGEQMLGAIANGICAGGLMETRGTVSRSRPLVFRVSYGSNGEFSIQPTAF
ncbi:MAG TPA: hypothetical protein VJ673_24520 [Aromatoleum sp.]|uniref:hypothetical protein n=1 Tax=Aromatoleum sp. TaxID=2307007 RepID=UPI002B49A606|nr:hypothetical protein [Aromatoleum sp.]HJV28863.1 hypothetical protein [Aromatoleum sp.]